MEKSGVFRTMMKFLGLVVLIDLILIGLVLMIGWWAGWQTEETFKHAIQIVGGLVIGIGVMGVIVNWEMIRRSIAQYNIPMMRKSPREMTQQDLEDPNQGYTFILTAFVAGGICLVIGWLM